MRRKYYKYMVVMAITAAMVLTGCSKNSSQTTSTNTEATESATDSTDTKSTESESTQTETTEEATTGTVQSDATVGEVTAIADGSITIAVGTLKDMGQNGGGAPNGKADGEKPEASENDGSAPSAPSGDKQAAAPDGNVAPNGNGAPAMEQGEAPADGTAPTDGERPSMLDLTGEELTITITDSTAITINSMNSTTDGTIDDIKEGDIITVTLAEDGKTATAITVQSFGRGDGQGQGKPQDSAQSTDTSTTESSEN